MKEQTELKSTVKRMAESLMNKAEEHSVDLSGVTIGNFNCYLDDAFSDGGETRCEHFVDLAWEYASGFGEFAGDEFEEAQWIAIEEAIVLVQMLAQCKKKYSLVWTGTKLENAETD
jgi:hypothetical protein